MGRWPGGRMLLACDTTSWVQFPIQEKFLKIKLWKWGVVVVFCPNSSYSEDWRRKSWNVRLAWATQQDKETKRKKTQKGWAWLTPQTSQVSEISLPRKTLKEKQFTSDSFRVLVREVGSNVPAVVRAWGHCSVAVHMPEVLPRTNKESSSCWRRQATSSCKRPGGAILGSATDSKCTYPGNRPQQRSHGHGNVLLNPHLGHSLPIPFWTGHQKALESYPWRLCTLHRKSRSGSPGKQAGKESVPIGAALPESLPGPQCSVQGL